MGVSYHYIEPSREIESNKDIVEIIEAEFKKNDIKYLKVKNGMKENGVAERT